ncbi:MAG: 50S ribosomal protein L25, partial [Pseudomonadota bacterium]
EASAGLKAGGVLNVVRHVVEVEVPADSIPENLTVDITDAQIGDVVNISAVDLPKGVVPTIQDRDFTLLTIQAPGGGASEEEETEAPAADEVESINVKEDDAE